MHDDGGGNVRVHAHGHDGEVGEGSSREHVEQSEELLLLEELPEGLTIHARHGDVRGEAEDGKQAKGKDQLAPDIGELERVVSGLNERRRLL